MATDNLQKCAEILGCTVSGLQEFPENIQEKLCSCMELYDVSDEETARQQYDEMERIWRTGTLILGMIEISENMDIPQEKLAALSENDKLNVMYEYAVGTDRETILRIMGL